METSLYFDISDQQWPIIYRAEYNVTFCGLEKLHPFDAGKWGNVYSHLKSAKFISDDTVIRPNEATKEDLLVVHSKKYLNSLKYSINVAAIAEVIPLCLVPNCFVQKSYLRPMRYQTGGSILAGKVALERGWSLNIGGGFHHCSANKGGGFCPYADITLLIRFLFDHYPDIVQNVLIVDLDAHQGNGYERDSKDFDFGNVYILDVYNKGIYPGDKYAKQFINRRVELQHYTEDEEYLEKVASNLKQALQEFRAQLIVYNAGTDVLKGDALGCLAISDTGIIKRDELVFKVATERKIPIVMLTSGGYLKKTAKIIASSILNLHEKGLITGPSVTY